jgi:hypothetical protein
MNAGVRNYENTESMGDSSVHGTGENSMIAASIHTGGVVNYKEIIPVIFGIAIFYPVMQSSSSF